MRMICDLITTCELCSKNSICKNNEADSKLLDEIQRIDNGYSGYDFFAVEIKCMHFELKNTP